MLGICSLHSLLLLPSEKQPLIRETSAFTECYTTGNTEAISLPVLQECFYSAISIITGSTSTRQGICSSPLHYHHLGLLYLPYVPQLMLQSPSVPPPLAGVQLFSLVSCRRVGEGGTGELEADTDPTVLFLSKLESLPVLTPLLHQIPWFPYPVFL